MAKFKIEVTLELEAKNAESAKKKAERLLSGQKDKWFQESKGTVTVAEPVDVTKIDNLMRISITNLPNGQDIADRNI